MKAQQPGLDRHLEGLEQPVEAPETGRTRIFAIFDVEHDRDLYELLCAQSRAPASGFDVVDGSQSSSEIDSVLMNVRCRIREADQVILICGAHTEASAHIQSEFLITQDEGVPYFLLWGRRDVMCTKPTGAKTSEGMYSWTGQFLKDRIAYNQREDQTQAETGSIRIVPAEVEALPRAITPATPCQR